MTVWEGFFVFCGECESRIQAHGFDFFFGELADLRKHLRPKLSDQIVKLLHSGFAATLVQKRITGHHVLNLHSRKHSSIFGNLVKPFPVILILSAGHDCGL